MARFSPLLIFSLASSCATITDGDVAEKKIEIEKSATDLANKCEIEAGKIAEKSMNKDRRIFEYSESLRTRLNSDLKRLRDKSCGAYHPAFSARYPECVIDSEKTILSRKKDACPDLDSLRESVAKECNESCQQKAALEKAASSKKYDEERAAFKKSWKSECTLLIQFQIVQNLGKNKYEIDFPCFGRDLKSGECTVFSGLIQGSRERGILQTIETQFEEAGLVRAIYVKRKGIKKMPLDDGFFGNFYQFEEFKRCEELSLKK